MEKMFRDSNVFDDEELYKRYEQQYKDAISTLMGDEGFLKFVISNQEDQVVEILKFKVRMDNKNNRHYYFKWTDVPQHSVYLTNEKIRVIGLFGEGNILCFCLTTPQELYYNYFIKFPDRSIKEEQLIDLLDIKFEEIEMNEDRYKITKVFFEKSYVDKEEKDNQLTLF